MLPITVKQLETFVAVANLGGFRRAAERLNLSQSAITTHVRHLEEMLGVPLFHRTTRSVALTSAGEDLLQRAERTLAGLEDTLQSFRDEANVQKGRVVIACAPSFASSILPPALAAFQAKHPQIFVQVREAYGSEILEALRAGAVDFGIGPFEHDDKDVVFSPLLTDIFVAVLPGDHTLAKRKHLSFQDIIDEPVLAMPQRSATRRALEGIFKDHGHALAPRFEMLHHQTLIGMAELGLGIAILPETAVPKSKDGAYAVIPLNQPVVEREMGILQVRGHKASPAAKAITQLLAEFIPSKSKQSG